MILGYHEQGSGPPLVLIHGFPVDGRVWNGQLKGLSGDRRVIAVDLRGRGRSPAADEEGWTMDTYAGDVADTLRDLEIDKADIAGFSMGGYVVFSLWRSHPEMFRSMILMSTRSTEDPPEGKEGRVRVASLAREKGSAALAGMMFGKFFAPGADEAVKDQVKEILQSIPGTTSASDSLAMGKRPDSTGDLSMISVPVVVVHGEQDALMPPEVARSMAEEVPDGRFAPIADAGHFALVEQPSAVNAAIAEFLSGLK